MLKTRDIKLLETGGSSSIFCIFQNTGRSHLTLSVSLYPYYLFIDVMDAYIVPESKQVILVDFNFFHPITDSKLFDWHELKALSCEKNRPVFRWVQSSEEICPAPNYVQSYPEDLLHLHRRIQQASLEELLDDVLGGNNNSDQTFTKN